MNKNYLKHLFKSNYKIMLIILTILLISFPIIDLLNGDRVNSMGLTTSVIISSIICIILPIYNMRFLYNKKHSSFIFNLPIKKKEIISTNLIFTFIEICIPFTISYLCGVIVNAILYDITIRFLQCYLFFIPIFMVLIIVHTFIVSKANNLLDSIIFSILYLLLPFILYMGIENVLDMTLRFSDLYLNFNEISIFGLIGNKVEFFSYQSHLINGEYSDIMAFGSFVSYIMYIIIGVVLLIVLVKIFENYDEKSAESKSDSIFGYRLLIPLITFSSLLLVNISNSIGIFLIICLLICYIIADFIYHRKISFKIRKFVEFTVLTGIVELLIIIFYFTIAPTVSRGNFISYDQVEITYSYYQNESEKDEGYIDSSFTVNKEKDETNEIYDLLMSYTEDEINKEYKKLHLRTYYFFDYEIHDKTTILYVVYYKNNQQVLRTRININDIEESEKIYNEILEIDRNIFNK